MVSFLRPWHCLFSLTSVQVVESIMSNEINSNRMIFYSCRFVLMNNQLGENYLRTSANKSAYLCETFMGALILVISDHPALSWRNK